MLVVNVMGRVFMDALDDPFAAIDRELAACPLGEQADAVIVDVHAEASSEKQAMGHHLDGRATLVVGTHTHVPTSDYRILSGGTAFQTDIGMCGDYNSVIGMDKEEPLRRFLTKVPGDRFTPAQGRGDARRHRRRGRRCDRPRHRRARRSASAARSPRRFRRSGPEPARIVLSICLAGRESFRSGQTSWTCRADARSSGRSNRMRRSLIRYRTAPERADENERLIRGVFAELAEKSPPGLGYLVLRAGDGSFFHVVANATESGSPITALDAFKAFQSGIRERCIEPPDPGR